MRVFSNCKNLVPLSSICWIIQEGSKAGLSKEEGGGWIWSRWCQDKVLITVMIHRVNVADKATESVEMYFGTALLCTLDISTYMSFCPSWRHNKESMVSSPLLSLVLDGIMVVLSSSRTQRSLNCRRCWFLWCFRYHLFCFPNSSSWLILSVRRWGGSISSSESSGEDDMDGTWSKYFSDGSSVTSSSSGIGPFL